MIQDILEKARTFKAYPSYWGRSIFPDTVGGVKAYNSFCRVMNSKEDKNRAELFPQLNNNDNNHVIKADDGYLIADMSGHAVVTDALAYSKEFANEMNMAEKMKTSKKNFLLNHALDIFAPEHKPLLDLATNKLLLAPVAQYLGSVPVLASIAIWYSPNDGDSIQRSQLYHLDGEDSRQIKCFLPIEEVTKDNGPLTLLSAKDSDQAYRSLKDKKKIKVRNEKIPDDMVYSEVPEEKAVQATGKPGTVAFVDTSRCYHYGSRPAKKPRLQLHIQYYSAYSVNMPVWGRKEFVPEKFGSEPLFKAVVGLSHLDFTKIRKKKNS